MKHDTEEADGGGGGPCAPTPAGPTSPRTAPLPNRFIYGMSGLGSRTTTMFLVVALLALATVPSLFQTFVAGSPPVVSVVARVDVTACGHENCTTTAAAEEGGGKSRKKKRGEKREKKRGQPSAASREEHVPRPPPDSEGSASDAPSQASRHDAKVKDEKGMGGKGDGTAELEEEDVTSSPCRLLDQRGEYAAYSALTSPTCNTFHEFDMTADWDQIGGGDDGGVGGSSSPSWYFLASGGRMMALGVEVPSFSHPILGEGVEEDEDGRDRLVLKVIRTDRGITEITLRANYVDAVLTERLSSSPRTPDLYGMCSQSVMTELALTDADHFLGSRGAGGPVLLDGRPRTSLERLEIARDAALAVADVHSVGLPGFPDGTFVHRDVRPWNFLIDQDGKIRIHDFNAGHYAGGQCEWIYPDVCNRWRSPEECRNETLTEKIDVWGLGNLYNFVLTGDRPYAGLDDRPGLVTRGVRPTIPQRLVDEFVAERDDRAFAAIHEAMNRCYTVSPVDRPSAGEVATFLGDALDDILSEKAKRRQKKRKGGLN